MELTYKNPETILGNVLPYQKEDYKKIMNLYEQLKNDFECELLAEFESYQGKEYFRYFSLYLTYKGFKFDVKYGDKSGFIPSLYKYVHKLPYYSHHDQIEIELKEPNNVFKITKPKVEALLNYQIEKYNKLKEFSDKKQEEINNYLEKVNRLNPDKNLNFDNDFKRIYIEKNGLIYEAHLQDNGYIQENLKLSYIKDKLDFISNI